MLLGQGAGLLELGYQPLDSPGIIQVCRRLLDSCRQNYAVDVVIDLRCLGDAKQAIDHGPLCRRA